MISSNAMARTRPCRGPPSRRRSRRDRGTALTALDRVTASAAAPGKRADSPSSASMRSSRLYLATRSERDGAPLLSWPVAGGNGQVGDRRVLGLAAAMADHRAPAVRRASSIVVSVSVSVPIWLSLTSTALARVLVDRALRRARGWSRAGRRRRAGAASPGARSASVQPAQSSSARPSSSDTIG